MGNMAYKNSELLWCTILYNASHASPFYYLDLILKKYLHTYYQSPRYGRDDRDPPLFEDISSQ